MGGGRRVGGKYLVFVYYPAAQLLVLALVEPLVLDDLVYRDVLEAQALRELLGVCCFAHAGGACDDDVGVLARHSCARLGRSLARARGMRRS
jgi:hypothetical protein